MFTLGANQRQRTSPPWKKWLKLITRGGTIMEIKKATIIPGNGTKSTHSKGFNLSEEELTAVHQCFRDSETTETIRANGCTYCLKSACPEQLVAFNGGRYLIITKANQAVIAVVCESRDKWSPAATWLLRVASHMGG